MRINDIYYIKNKKSIFFTVNSIQFVKINTTLQKKTALYFSFTQKTTRLHTKEPPPFLGAGFGVKWCQNNQKGKKKPPQFYFIWQAFSLPFFPQTQFFFLLGKTLSFYTRGRCCNFSNFTNHHKRVLQSVVKVTSGHVTAVGKPLPFYTRGRCYS